MKEFIKRMAIEALEDFRNKATMTSLKDVCDLIARECITMSFHFTFYLLFLLTFGLQTCSLVNGF